MLNMLTRISRDTSNFLTPALVFGACCGMRRRQTRRSVKTFRRSSSHEGKRTSCYRTRQRLWQRAVFLAQINLTFDGVIEPGTLCRQHHLDVERPLEGLFPDQAFNLLLGCHSHLLEELA